MEHSTIIGIDIAKRSFALHGASQDGSKVFGKSLKREKVLDFPSEQPACLVAIECCGGAHFWARSVQALNHEVKLIPAAVVKRYLAGQKNDANDAAAVAEAASRAEVRGIRVKSTDVQGHAVLFRTRAMLIQQRTALANAIRGHLLEFGIVIARGFAALSACRSDLNDGKFEMPDALPEVALASREILFEQLDDLNARVEACEAKMLEVTKPTKTANAIRPCLA